MSFPYPRRVKDLPTLDYDDDFVTPRKPNKNAKPQENNKENEDGGYETYANLNQRFYPKRSCELDSELDSELDESIRNDNFNCAILNESFILSPNRNESEEGAVCETPAGKLLRQRAADKNENSFYETFQSIDLSATDEATPNKQSIIINTPSLRCPILESIEEQNELENSDGTPQNSDSLPRKISPTPYRPGASVAKPPTVIVTSNSTAKANEPQFVTPQVHTFSMQRRQPRDLCSTQSQKTRAAALANEFRSQKVLFQTPIALSRAPLSLLSNDSVTLSLCDTISEAGNTPGTAENSVAESEEVPVKTKKSLDTAFAAVDKKNELEKPEQKTIESARNTGDAIPNAEATKSNQSCLKINNIDYIICKRLGRGGSSTVYLAQRADDGNEYALKVVNLHGDPIAVKGYMNETELLKRLQGHTCVVALYDYQLLQKESQLFVVMEKGDSDLQKILSSYTTNLPLYVLVNYLYQMLQAVNYIHQKGVIHSDLKPANFLMVKGRLKLIDFGIASNIALDSTSIIKFSQTGTFNYISPEALTDTSSGTSPMRNNQPKIKISTKSDVWSLGCILYLFLYKKTPFSHIQNIYAKINAISNPRTTIEYADIPSYYPNVLIQMAKNCLQHDPKQRPSCAEILQYPFHMFIPLQNLAVTVETSTLK